MKLLFDKHPFPNQGVAPSLAKAHQAIRRLSEYIAQNIMPSILHFLDEMNQGILQDFSPEQVHMVYHLLQRMNRNLLKELTKAGDPLDEDQS